MVFRSLRFSRSSTSISPKLSLSLPQNKGVYSHHVASTTASSIHTPLFSTLLSRSFASAAAAVSSMATKPALAVPKRNTVTVSFPVGAFFFSICFFPLFDDWSVRIDLEKI